MATAAAALLLTGCSAAPRGTTQESWLGYLDTERRLKAQGTALELDSETEQRAIDRFQALLSDFKAPDFRSRIREVYADEVFFNDTLKTLHGVDAVERHLIATADALESGTVEFVDTVSADGDYYFRWVMMVRFKRVARGEEKQSVGMTHVRFDPEGKVLLHQDFWDSAGGLFEHTPVLGWMLRRVRNRL
jgi:limonene-1,2-epoxide hydrolase